MKAFMKQITVRGVPSDIARALEEEKNRRGTSLNQTILDLLRQSLGLKQGLRYDNGLSALAGTWTVEEHANFEANTRQFEQIDEELWK